MLNTVGEVVVKVVDEAEGAFVFLNVEPVVGCVVNCRVGAIVAPVEVGFRVVG